MCKRKIKEPSEIGGSLIYAIKLKKKGGNQATLCELFLLITVSTGFSS